VAENLLYYGDNLDVLRRHVKDESVDLVYLDPPFNSNATYNALFGEEDGSRSAAQIKAFEDTWRWDQGSARAYEEVIEAGGPTADVMRSFHVFLGGSNMTAYLAMMAPRLVELRRVMKADSSIYLHCDPTASHYLKLLLDAVFGAANFRDEIIWQRTNARSTDQRWPHIHDVILFYSKTSDFYFAPTQVAADIAKMPHTLITGPDGDKYQTYELTGAGVTREGDSGKPWRGFDPTKFGRHWANAISQREEWDAAGLIHWPTSGSRGGFPRRRDPNPFEAEARLVTIGDVWTDIDRLNQTAKERLGYPTQKPQALLERIVRASSRDGALVLDPFCGCGTTVAAAENLGRRWIGIDITHLAIGLIKNRLTTAFRGKAKYRIIGEPTDLAGAIALANEPDKYQFQWWALGQCGARPAEQRKGADRGIDGRLFFHDEGAGGDTKQIIFSVKAGHTGSAHVRDLIGVLDQENAQIGVLISLQKPTRDMRQTAATAGFYSSPWGTKHPRVQLLTVSELLDGKKVDMPASNANVSLRKAPRAIDAPTPKPKLPGME
jgi:site-specific DNA-methyltransferase (adenine-specific)